MIRYRAGYKYQLVEAYRGWLSHVHVTELAICEYVSIYPSPTTADTRSSIQIERGYAWDGASGPTMVCVLSDDPDGSPTETAREASDDELYWTCREDGMSAFRAWYVLKAVHCAGGGHAKLEAARPILTAP